MAFERIGLGGELRLNIQQAQVALQQAHRQFSMLQRKVEGQTPVLTRFGMHFQRSIDRMRMAAQKLSQSFSQIGTGIRNATFAMMPLAYGMYRGAKQAANFEHQMAAVGAITGATGTEFEKLADKAKHMGVVSVFSASQAAQAMEYMARAGATNTEIISGLDGVMNAAAADGIDLASAANVVAVVTKSMGREWKEASNIADVLALTSARANTNMLLLGESFTYGAATARDLEISLSDTAAIFGALGDAGLKGSMAGTSFTNMMNKLTKPTSKAKKLMQRWGITLDDTVKGGLKPMNVIVEQLGSRINNIRSATERAAVMSELFGIRGKKAFAALMAKGPAKLASLMKEIGDSTGAAATMAERRLNTLKGRITLFLSSVEAAFIEFFEGMMKPWADAFKGITESMNKVITSVQMMKKGGKDLDDVIKGYGKDVALATARERGWTQEMIDKMPYISSYLNVVARRASTEKRVTMAIQEGAGAERDQLARMIQLERIGMRYGSTVKAMAQGVMDAIQWMRKGWETLKNTVIKWVNKLGQALGDEGVRKLTAFIGKAAMVATALVPLGLALGAIVWILKASLWPVIKGLFGLFRQLVLGPIKMFIVGMWRTMMVMVRFSVTAMAHLIPALIKVGARFAWTAMVAVGKFVPALLRVVSATVRLAVVLIANLFAALFRVSGAFIKSAMIATGKFVVALLKAAWAAIALAGRLMVGLVVALAGVVKGFLVASFVGMRSLVPTLLAIGKSFMIWAGPIILLIGLIVGAMKDMKKENIGLFNVMKEVWGKISAAVGGFFRGFLQHAKVIWHAVKRVFSAIWRIIDLAFGWMWKDSKETTGAMKGNFENFGSFVGEIIISVLDGFASVFEFLWKAIKDGQSYFQKFLNSVDNAIVELKDTVGGYTEEQYQKEKRRVKNIGEWINREMRERDAAIRKRKQEMKLERERLRAAAARKTGKEREKKKPAFDVSLNLKDESVIENKNTLCVEGKPMGEVITRHQQEIHERAGFKHVAWNKRTALEYGSITLAKPGVAAG